MKSNVMHSKNKSGTKMVTAQQAMFELKQRVVLSLNKLADRDTFQIGVEELERTAERLTPDMITPFLTCIVDTDSEQKSAVRKECVRVMGILARSQGCFLAPHLGKMVSCIVKRLKDADSVVRDACVETSGVLARILGSGEGRVASFALLVRPLFEALGEQNRYVQSGAALCLARVIDESCDPPLSALSQMLTRVIKLLKNQHFMAKPALIELIRSIIQVGGVKGNALSIAVTSILEALKSTDWTTRKAASVALSDIAMNGISSLSSYKSSCLRSLESCRFDKVKPVRDSILHAIQCWKALHGSGSLEPSEAGSSTKEIFCGDYVDVTCASDSGLRETSFRKTGPISALNGTKKRAQLGLKKSCIVNVNNHDSVKLNDWHIDISIPKSRDMQLIKNEKKEIGWSCTQNTYDTRSANAVVKNDYVIMGDKPESPSVSDLISQSFETKHITTLRDCLEEGDSTNLNGRDSGSSISETGQECVTTNERNSLCSTVTGFSSLGMHGCCQHTANELAFMKQQIEEINSKQSNLLDLIQVFIGNTADNLSGLQLKVNSLENAIDKITYSLAQQQNYSINGSSNLMKKSQTACSSPMISTQMPRPSIDAPSMQQKLMFSNREILDGEGLYTRSRITSTKEGSGTRKGCALNTTKNSANGDVPNYCARSLQIPQSNRQRSTEELFSVSVSNDSARLKNFDSIVEFKEKVKELLRVGDVEAAYIEVLQSCDDHYLIELMCRTGPALDRLSQETAIEVLGIIAKKFTHERFRSRSNLWLQQVVDLSILHGPTHLLRSTQAQMDFLAVLQELATKSNDSAEQRNLLQLASKFSQVLGETACRTINPTPVLQGIRQCA